MTTPTQPPDGAAKWASDAAREHNAAQRSAFTEAGFTWPFDQKEDDDLTALILRHHTAHAASERDATVRLLEEAFNFVHNTNVAIESVYGGQLETKLRLHLTRLKEQTR